MWEKRKNREKKKRSSGGFILGNILGIAKELLDSYSQKLQLKPNCNVAGLIG